MMMPHWLRHLTPVRSTHWSPAPWNACTWCSPSRSRTPRCFSAVCLTPKTRAAWASLLPKDSKLTAAVTKAVDDLDAQAGTIKKLQDKWLAEYTTDLTELKK